ncbi:oxygen-independent coproporphyrinogen III oxidase [Rhodanobacter denitrificans]|uniref:Coproporphyrinogen-III oxidase n=1 Tax=Rhodanobacter denitrificans TaxID=666685 RepID=M4NDZ5_9GAMM|nr:oxygen-independent coproporphyrinogen III oxidase [Rhodanobacter denitrificans]AGG87708.1 oxygen-independent coproporphyrinogen III oxidase [Rhodanobacter denitrificans]UJJ59609.1 oxygen-independent coproporphyrinogen III oxidase [Rhodanobacter denitrificans]UJM86877.1 oxygen-independent coproporphyrinogen III oxidase [Rhodanobacter denitrificans]
MAIPITPPEFDPALIARYDVAGPRYTSYPTAPHFKAEFDEAALRAVIRASNEEPIPRPLSVYVHVPFCMSPCFYCGCNRVITRDVTQADRYLERLYREIELIAPLFDRDRPVRQLHFGGGTPNFLDTTHMGELLESLARHFSFSHAADREYGIEIDPRFADAAYIRAMGELGFNRLSVGIQDFDPVVQKAVNRIQSFEQTREVIEAARTSGFRSASVDLIYGLPFQSVDGFSRTLDQVVALNPDRVAVYGYAHLPEMFKAQRQIEAADLPDAATRLALFGRALEHLSAAGYVYIGMDHFAKASDELVLAQRAGTLQRNFQGYSTHGDCDIVGLGVSAIGRIGDSYSQNARDLIGYYAALDAGRLPLMRGLQLDEDDLIRRELINELMCHGSVEKQAFGARHRLLFDEYFARERQRLLPLIEDGLVTENPREIRVTSRGRLLLRIIAMCFDAYLDDAAQAPRYSRVI